MTNLEKVMFYAWRYIDAHDEAVRLEHEHGAGFLPIEYYAAEKQADKMETCLEVQLGVGHHDNKAYTSRLIPGRDVVEAAIVLARFLFEEATE